MTYPKQLYRKGGPYGLGAKAYSVAGCDNAEQEAKLVAGGWHETLDAALGLEQEAFTREELEEKAKELGVSFNARTKDETLVNRIAEALG